MRYPLIYNEREEAEKIYNTGFTKGFTRHEALMVAKHFRHILGYGDARVRSELEKFSSRHDPTGFNAVRQRNTIKSIVSQSRREFGNNTSGVSITLSEMETIGTLPDYRTKRMLFIMFVLSKFCNGYLNMVNWGRIRECTPSRISNSDIYKHIGILCKANMVKAGGGYHKFLFVDNSSPSIISIDSKNIYSLGRVFVEFFGKDIMACERCGEQCERKAYNQKRCPNCRKELEKEKHLTRQRRYDRKKNLTPHPAIL